MPVSHIVVATPNFPSLKMICNLIRAKLNDSLAGATGTPGEGQIITDDPVISPFMLPFLNQAIRDTYVAIRNAGSPALIKDNFILSAVPPINGPLGSMIPDPTIQVFFSPFGYFDGSQMWPKLALPSDFVYPLKLWQRITGGLDLFLPMTEAIDGLPPIYQTEALGQWEWRGSNIYLVGSLLPHDVRFRYQASFPEFFSPNLDFASTFVTLPESGNYIACNAAEEIASSLGADNETLGLMHDKTEYQLFLLKNTISIRAQRKNYHRRAYGSEDEWGILSGPGRSF